MQPKSPAPVRRTGTGPRQCAVKGSVVGVACSPSKPTGIETRARSPKPPDKKKKCDQEIDAASDNRGKSENSKHTQFKNGNKNGRGRPKGSKNRSTLAKEALDRKIILGGEAMTVRELAFMQQATKAGKGELKAFNFLLETEGKTPASGLEGSASQREPLTDSERLAIEHYHRDLFSKEQRDSK
jgi:hypothetical protein